MRLSLLLFRIAAPCLAAIAAAPPLAADEVADFYKGKSGTLFVGYPPGGGYDVYARVIARYLTKHVPGNPQFVVRNKPGAASLNLVSELYNVLPRDGTVIGMFARSVAMDRLLGRDAPTSIRSSSTGSAAPTTKCRSARSGTPSASARSRSSWRGR
jgi:hypothetical protein